MTVTATGTASRNTAATTAALCSLAAIGASAIIAASVTAYPDPSEGWLYAARYTARFSFLVFLVVFVARPWHRLRRSNATRWALLHRRGLGLAFATAHFIHLYALTRFRVITEQPPDLVTLIAGGGAYVMLTAMVATSNDASVRALGARNWKRLHTVGVYWIWFIFFQSYASRVAAGNRFFLPLTLVALAALALRIAARVRRPA